MNYRYSIKFRDYTYYYIFLSYNLNTCNSLKKEQRELICQIYNNIFDLTFYL